MLKLFPPLLKYESLDFRIRKLLEIATKLELISSETQYIHIAGTSGKGSITTTLNYLFSSLGYTTGSFSSPFVFRLEENYLINTKPAKSGMLEKRIYWLYNQIKKLNFKNFYPSFFEAKTLLALKLFIDFSCEIAIFETGLGGRFDATNILRNKISVVSRIGKDHTEVLGDTYEKIAFEKAGIIKKGNTLIYLIQRKSVDKIIFEIAEKMKAKVYTLDLENETRNIKIQASGTSFEYKTLRGNFLQIFTKLLGYYQVENTALSLRVLEVFLKSRKKEIEIFFPQIKQALSKVKFIGRLNLLKIGKSRVVIDSAHNPQKMEALVKSLKAIFRAQKMNFVISVKYGKDLKKILKIIEPISDSVFYFEYQINKFLRSFKYKEVLSAVGNMSAKIKKINPSEIESLIETHPEKVWVITGSIYGLSKLSEKSKKIKMFFTQFFL